MLITRLSASKAAVGVAFPGFNRGADGAGSAVGEQLGRRDEQPVALSGEDLRAGQAVPPPGQWVGHGEKDAVGDRRRVGLGACGHGRSLGAPRGAGAAAGHGRPVDRTSRCDGRN